MPNSKRIAAWKRRKGTVFCLCCRKGGRQEISIPPPPLLPPPKAHFPTLPLEVLRVAMLAFLLPPPPGLRAKNWRSERINFLDDSSKLRSPLCHNFHKKNTRSKILGPVLKRCINQTPSKKSNARAPVKFKNFPFSKSLCSPHPSWHPLTTSLEKSEPCSPVINGVAQESHNQLRQPDLPGFGGFGIFLGATTV